MKEVKLIDQPMIGGCCVCSDERGWSENPLVYCDGPNCTVAVHQACYGIVSVPKGPWYCQKCESQERPTRLRCELCPNRDGALKKTDTASWVHVVCALYIPEVRFGNVTTMEPILLELVPQDRYSKVCYICQDNGKASKAHSGACMQCNKSGCKQSFHVTCAQAMGMLCEEAGNYLDNVKYCGYCKHHYSKLRKSNNVRTIPPFKPVEASGPPSSPEKECEKAQSPNTSSNVASTSSADSKQSSQNGSKKKSTASSNTSTSSISSSSSPSFSKQSNSRASSPTKISGGGGGGGSGGGGGGQASFNSSNSSSNLSTDMLNVSANDKPLNNNSNSKDTGNSSNKNSSKSNSKSGTSSSSSTKGSTKEPREPKHSKVRNHSKDSASSNEYDLSNVSTSKDTGSGPVTLSAPIKEIFNKKFTTSNFTESIVVASEPVLVKKRKLEKNESNKLSISSGISDDVNREVIKDVSVTIVPLSDELKKQKVGESDNKNSHSSGGSLSSNIIKQNEAGVSAVSLVVSVPLSTTTLPGVNLVSNTNTSLQSHQVPTIKSFASEVSPFTITNRSHNYPNIIIQQPADLQVKGKEQHQQHHPFLGDKQGLSAGGAIVRNPSPSPTAISKISVCTNLGRPKINSNQSACSSVFSDLTISKSAGPATITPIDKNNTKMSQMITDDASLSRMSSTPDDGSFSDLKISYEAQSNPYESASITRADIKNSPPSSPTHDMMGTHKRNHSSLNDASKDMKMFSAKDMQPTHMLGNQLNPSSSVAQKMTDQLYMELEAHSVYTSSSMDSNTQLMGPVFPGRQLNNARNTAATQPQGPSLASMLGGNGQPTAHGNTPQSLEQLLERQWEQGSQFLMEQAQHFDIASLLSCLHQLRTENIRLEEHVNNLVARRDHLLAVNARLAIPLNQVPQGPNQNSGTFNSLHLNGTTEPNSRSRSQHLK